MGLERHQDGLSKIRERLANEQPLSHQERSKVVRYLDSLAFDISSEPTGPKVCTECAQLRAELAKRNDAAESPHSVMLAKPFQTGLRFGCGLIIAEFIFFLAVGIVLLFFQ